VAVDPYNPDGEIPTVEHAIPLLVLGTVIVPVTPEAIGPTSGDAPSCKPFAPTGAPGTIPSEEVAPSGGVSMPTWASAGLQHSKGKAVAIKKDLMEDLPDKSGGVRNERPQAPQSVRPWGQRLSFSWPLSLTDKIVSAAPRSD